MGDSTSIEWTATRHPDGSVTPGASWNPIRAQNLETRQKGHYCEKVSRGCKHCYAERWQHRLGTHLNFTRNNRDKLLIYLDEKTLDQPLRWKRPRKIFLHSMTDTFGRWVRDRWLRMIFEVMLKAHWHTYIILTKRPERMYEELKAMFTDAGLPIPSNWWICVSVEDQKTADERIPWLTKIPAAVRGISAEPLLGPINLHPWLCEYGSVERPEQGYGHFCEPSGLIHWVFTGGESGSGSEPMNPAWPRALRDQCVAAGVKFFFKQWGDWAPAWGDATHLIYSDGRLIEGTHEHPDAWRERIAEPIRKIGKKKAGRLLDGREWNEYPEMEQTDNGIWVREYQNLRRLNC